MYTYIKRIKGQVWAQLHSSPAVFMLCIAVSADAGQPTPGQTSRLEDDKWIISSQYLISL